MATEPLRIGYAGSLAAFVPGQGQKSSVPVLNWFWTYSAMNVDQSTRSGYYLFRALRYGIDHKLFAAEDIVVDLWGIIAPGNRMQADAMGLKEVVQISGYAGKAESKERLSRCDALFLPMECGKDGNPTLFIPGKVFEYMQAGKPVLCLTRGGDCADILSRSGLGVLADPYNEKEVAEQLARLVQMKRSGTQFVTPDQEYITQYDFSRLTSRLAHEFDNLLR